MLESSLVWFVRVGAVLFLPLETYLTLQVTPLPVSGYIVNVLGVFIALWGTIALRKRKPYGAGVLAAGLGWTTAAAWRATNLRYSLADRGQALDYGSTELRVILVLTVIAAAAFVASLVLLIGREKA